MFYTWWNVMEVGFVTMKVTKEAHNELRNLKFEFKVDSYPEVIDILLEEHRQKQGVPA